MTDSLSEKERNVDVFEKRLCHWQKQRLPLPSVALVGTTRTEDEDDDSALPRHLDKQWLSAADVNSGMLSSEHSRLPL